MSDEILRMIETVSPDDTAKLDEIDFFTEKFLHNQIYTRDESGRRIDAFGVYVSEPLAYTRSRDALKAIRPEGWRIRLLHSLRYNGWMVESDNQTEPFGPYNIHTSPYLPTEELAELHAIIQAIEYDRTAVNAGLAGKA